MIIRNRTTKNFAVACWWYGFYLVILDKIANLL